MFVGTFPKLRTNLIFGMIIFKYVFFKQTNQLCASPIIKLFFSQTFLVSSDPKHLTLSGLSRKSWPLIWATQIQSTSVFNPHLILKLSTAKAQTKDGWR